MYANPWLFVFLSKGGYKDCHRCYSRKDQKEYKKPCRQRQSHMQKPNRQFGNISMTDN